MKKIVISIDSFKGCMSSLQVCNAAAEGVHLASPLCEVIQVPIADGGEGVLEVLLASKNGHKVLVKARDPLMRERDVEYGISADGSTAFIEMAAVSGLTLIASEERNPMNTTSYGVGELIADALNRGCREFIIGIGGSATNDAGLGMLQALGYRFLDNMGEALGVGGKMMELVEFIDDSTAHPLLKASKFTIACDVNNPFCGKNGAAHVYGLQKGADFDMINRLDAGMEHLSEVITSSIGKEIKEVAGAGAAGGIGGGFLAFLDAELKPGIDLLLEVANFEEHIQDADLIITGEGRADRQTLMGKVPSGILARARKHKIPVALVAGMVKDTELLNKAGFNGVFSIVQGPVSAEEAMRPIVAMQNIRQTVSQIVMLLDR